MLSLLCNTTQAADNNKVLSEENKRLVWNFFKNTPVFVIFDEKKTILKTPFQPKSPWSGPFADSLQKVWSCQYQVPENEIFKQFMIKKPFDCEHCGVGFKTEKGLKNHIELVHDENSNNSVHDVQKLFDCEHCGVGFETEKDLKN